MIVSSFVVDYSALLKPNVLVALERLPEGGLGFFCGLLQSGSLEVSPRAHFGATALAGDDTGIFRFVWNDELVAAALGATKLYLDLIAHEEPRR